MGARGEGTARNGLKLFRIPFLVSNFYTIFNYLPFRFDVLISMSHQREIAQLMLRSDLRVRNTWNHILPRTARFLSADVTGGQPGGCHRVRMYQLERVSVLRQFQILVYHISLIRLITPTRWIRSDGPRGYDLFDESEI